MHRIHGVDPASFDGTMDVHLAVVHPEDVEPLRGALAAAVDAGRPLDVEYRIVRGDGAERWLYSRAEPTFGSLGAVVGLSGFAQDVTDRATCGALAVDRSLRTDGLAHHPAHTIDEVGADHGRAGGGPPDAASPRSTRSARPRRA